MREKVCIILNEREPRKAKAAEALQDKLQAQGVQASRIEIDAQIEEVVRLRNPAVLVLDYLIGDYTTGLDILGAIARTGAGASRPEVIFLTDEPSVRVAVEAMRLGAQDYFELDHPSAISAAAQKILDLLALQKEAPPKKLRPQPGLDDLVGRSQAFQESLQRAKALSKRSEPVIVIEGPAGAGATAFARAIFSAKNCSSYCRTLDLSLFDGELAAYFGLEHPSSANLILGRNLSVIVEDGDNDDGELLELISARKARLWPPGCEENSSFLIICCHKEETSRSWRRMTGADYLFVPGLAARKEDIPALIQRFATEAAQDTGEPVAPIPSDVCAWASGLDWPGEVKQLRSVIIDAAATRGFNPQPLDLLITEARSRWTAPETGTEVPLSPLAAWRALESCEYRYRIAAARCGCTVSRLKKIISGEPQSRAEVHAQASGGAE